LFDTTQPARRARQPAEIRRCASIPKPQADFTRWNRPYLDQAPVRQGCCPAFFRDVGPLVPRAALVVNSAAQSAALAVVEIGDHKGRTSKLIPQAIPSSQPTYSYLPYNLGLVNTALEPIEGSRHGRIAAAMNLAPNSAYP